MSVPTGEVAKVKEAINAHMMAAGASNAFTAGVVGTGKPLAVAPEKDKPKMRSGPTLGPRKAAKVSDIF